MAGAAALRLVGLKTGLPYVYNADENSHFVPRAVGMFGHSLDPGYFANPPAFTYLLHGLLALRWGTDPARVGDVVARDPGAVYTLARAAAALLGAAAAGLLAWAGARLVDRRTGLVAGALLAVSFLAVDYGHYALNDAPATLPAALALAGAAGVLRSGRRREYALAGLAVGVGCATKYTVAVLALPLLAAGALAPGRRAAGLALAAALAAAGFLAANPYALLDLHAFAAGLRTQAGTAGAAGGKLGLTGSSGLGYYLASTTWGLGWLPAMTALAGAAALLVCDRRLAALLVPAPVVLVLYLGLQSRFFARWLLPVYPLLCLLAAWAAVRAAAWLAGRVRHAWRTCRWPAAAAGLLLCAQGLVFSIHGDVVKARDDTRALARAWLVAHVPAGSRVVIEPVVPDQWASDPGRPSAATRSGVRWVKWPASRSVGRPVRLEDYERTLRPALVAAYRRAGYCWVLIGSTQYGRAYAQPRAVPAAIRYYAALRAGATLAYSVSPAAPGAREPAFSFDFSFNGYRLSVRRPGPRIAIYHLKDCRA